MYNHSVVRQLFYMTTGNICFGYTKRQHRHTLPPSVLRPVCRYGSLYFVGSLVRRSVQPYPSSLSGPGVESSGIAAHPIVRQISLPVNSGYPLPSPRSVRRFLMSRSKPRLGSLQRDSLGCPEYHPEA